MLVIAAIHKIVPLVASKIICDHPVFVNVLLCLSFFVFLTRKRDKVNKSYFHDENSWCGRLSDKRTCEGNQVILVEILTGVQGGKRCNVFTVKKLELELASLKVVTEGSVLLLFVQ